jgi:hypothetical protein
VALPHERDDPRLNGRGLGPAQLVDGPEGLRAKCEASEVRGGLRTYCKRSNRKRLLRVPVCDRMRPWPRELVPASARVSPDPTHHEEDPRHTTRDAPLASPAETHV